MGLRNGILIILISSTVFLGCDDIQHVQECKLKVETDSSFIELPLCECPPDHFRYGSFCLISELKAKYSIHEDCNCTLANTMADFQFSDDSSTANIIFYSDWIKVCKLDINIEEEGIFFNSERPEHLECMNAIQTVCISGQIENIDTIQMTLTYELNNYCSDSIICKMMLTRI